MFIKPGKIQSFFHKLFGGVPKKLRRPLAGQERMILYMERWSNPPPQATRSRIELVPHTEAFIVVDGRSINSIPELRSVLLSITDEHFDHHTKGQHNDFSNWLRDIWQEETAATILERSRSRHEALAVVERLCRRRGFLD